jgi:hypothetical protein
MGNFQKERIMQETKRAEARGQAPEAETLNALELTAIESLFALAAAEQDTTRDTIQTLTARRFGAPNISAVARKDYDDVIRFLVELVDDLGAEPRTP